MQSVLFPGVSTTTTTTTIKPDQDDWNNLFEVQDIKREGYMCSTCTSSQSVEQFEDEIVCTACGEHLGYNIDTSAEYRWFGPEDRGTDPSRVGNPMNPLLPESSLGTRILTRPGEYGTMRRIRQYHLWTIMPYRERTLWGVFELLQVRASNAGISAAIVEETKQLYAQVSPRCICRGLQKDALLAACLYESLKRHDTPRRPQEIADIFQIDVKLVTRGVKQFSGLLEGHLHTNTVEHRVEEAAKPTPSTSFRHYIEPAMYKLETPRVYHGRIVEEATRIGNLIDELGICPETTPSSLAACSLVVALEILELDKSHTDVAKSCSISAATLQKCLKRIENWRPVLTKKQDKTEG
jgi:transcription initiation factor TFIIB